MSGKKRSGEESKRFAKVYRAIWQDGDFRSLSSGAQWLFFALISQEDLKWTGHLPHLPARWATLSPDLTPARISEHVGELVKEKFVVVDDEYGELLIRTYVRNDEVHRQPNLVKAMWKDFGSIYSETIRAAFLAELPVECFNARHNPPLAAIPEEFIPSDATIEAAEKGPQQSLDWESSSEASDESEAGSVELAESDPDGSNGRDNSEIGRDNSESAFGRDNSDVRVIATPFGRDNSETPGQNPSGNPSEKGCRTTATTNYNHNNNPLQAPPAAEAAPPRAHPPSGDDTEKDNPMAGDDTEVTPLRLIHFDDEPTTKPKRAKAPDPVWDAIVEAFGWQGMKLDRGTSSRVGKLANKVVRACASDDDSDDDLAAQVHERVKRYRERMPRNTILTVEALAKHWVALGADDTTDQGAASDRSIGDWEGVKSGRIAL